MRSALAHVVLGSLALAALAAPAAAQVSTLRSTHWCGTPQVPVAGGAPPVVAAAATRTIYLNKNGGTYNIANAATNAATNTVDARGWGVGVRTAVLPPIEAMYNWPVIAQCVRTAFARYDLRIVETEPTSGAYLEAVVGAGDGSQLGRQGLLGIAAADNFCGVTERGIAFSLSTQHNSIPQRDAELCATIAHEIGHLLALEHETLPADEMSYVLVSQSPPKAFQMQNSSCGTSPQDVMTNCSCGGTQTNSHMRLSQFVGLRATETVPPAVAITSPTGGTIPRTFTITATATDASGIQEVRFTVDGSVLGTDTEPDGSTYAIDAVRLGEGTHTIVAEATDGANNRATATVAVEVTFDCGGCGDGQTCIEGECLVSNGEACSEDVPCAGGLCVESPSNGPFCTQVCDLATDDCPSGFACADVGTGDGTGVCNFSDDGGCCSTGSQGRNDPFAAIGLGAIGLGLLVSRRRRRGA